jgi:ribosomal protein L16 Arg81 hydroxylase
MSSGHFRQLHLGRRSVYVPGDEPGKFEALFRPQDVDELLEIVCSDVRDIDVFVGAQLCPVTELPGGRAQANELLMRLADGATVHLVNVQRYWLSINRLCQALSAELPGLHEADLWLSSFRQGKPFLHYDPQDIYVLQLFGSKRWEVWSGEHIKYEPSGAGRELDRSKLGPPSFVCEVQPGDLIYMPRGTPHAVSTITPHSIHIGVGSHPPTWGELLKTFTSTLQRQPGTLQGRLPDSLSRHGASPEDICIGLREVWPQLLQEVDWPEVRRQWQHDLLRCQRSPSDGHVYSQLLNPSTPSANAAYERRCDATVSQCEPGNSLVEFVEGGAVSAPPEAAAALAFITSAKDPFRTSDLPGGLSESSRIALLDRMVRVGLLRRC